MGADGAALTTERTPIAGLHPHELNPRLGDIGAISESLAAHGQYRPIVVQRQGSVILAGTHTMLAAKALGWTEIDAVFVDVDDNEALRILLVDNRTADAASYNDHALVELLAGLSQGPEGLSGTGWDDSDLDHLVAVLNEPFPEALARAARSPLPGHTEHRCPVCSHEWTGSCTPLP